MHQIFLEDGKRLQAANSTRWNSQFYMLNSVLAVREEKMNSLECSHNLTAYERKPLLELCAILKHSKRLPWKYREKYCKCKFGTSIANIRIKKNSVPYKGARHFV